MTKAEPQYKNSKNINTNSLIIKKMKEKFINQNDNETFFYAFALVGLPTGNSN